MALFNCCFYLAEYFSEFNAVHLVFNGKVGINDVIKLRNILESLSESQKIEKLIFDFTECDRAFIDYNSHVNIAFWKNLENNCLKKILLIIPQKNFTEKALKSWESFYNKNKLTIEVSAISDRKLMQLYILNERLANQLN